MVVAAWATMRTSLARPPSPVSPSERMASATRRRHARPWIVRRSASSRISAASRRLCHGSASTAGEVTDRDPTMPDQPAASMRTARSASAPATVSKRSSKPPASITADRRYATSCVPRRAGPAATRATLGPTGASPSVGARTCPRTAPASSAATDRSVASAASQSGHGADPASRNTIHGAVPARQPRSLAATGPRPDPGSTTSRSRSAAGASPSSEPGGSTGPGRSSITMTSRGAGPRAAARARSDTAS